MLRFALVALLWLPGACCQSNETAAKIPGPPLTSSTYAITAATPLLVYGQSHPLMPDFGTLPPYVHWTCYTPPAVTNPDPLNCCQHIYRVMEEAPELLCWQKKGACGMDKKREDRQNHDKQDLAARSAFLKHCTYDIQPLPALRFQRSLTPELELTPRYALVMNPAIVPYVKEWKQVWWFSSRPNITPGHMTTAISPVHLPFDYVNTFDFGVPVVEDTRETFGAELETEMRIVRFDDQRLMQHSLTLSPSANTTVDRMKGQFLLTIAYFLPEGVDFQYERSCEAKCNGRCGLTYDRGVKTYTDGANIMPLYIDFRIVKPTRQCVLTWETTLLMEDEDVDLIIPGPAILEARWTDEDGVERIWRRPRTYPAIQSTSRDWILSDKTVHEEL